MHKAVTQNSAHLLPYSIQVGLAVLSFCFYFYKMKTDSCDVINNWRYMQEARSAVAERPRDASCPSV